MSRRGAVAIADAVTETRTRPADDARHLSGRAIKILKALPRTGERGFLFTTTGETPVSGFGRARDRLTAVMVEIGGGAAIEPFTRHDLRRTAATGMAGIGIAPRVVDKILNHVSGAIRGVAAIYNRHAYIDERKAAIEAWSRRVESLADSAAATSNVLAIKAAN